MKRWLATTVALLFLCNSSLARVEPPATYQFDGAALVANKLKYDAGDPAIVKLVQTLVKQADKALAIKNPSVMDKPFTPPSGDKHDYMSLSPYWWPDPSKPDGKPYLRKDGQVNPEREQYDQPTLEKMSDSAQTLALAYFFTGQEKYAEKSASLIRTWFIDPATRMTPHVRYAQFVPGNPKSRGVGVLETSRVRRVIDAEALLAGSNAWTRQDHEQLRAWIADYLKYLLNSEQGNEERTAENNHGTWFALQAGTYAVYLGDESLAKTLISEEGMKRIASQIEPDGKQPHELVRTKAYDYCRYNLEALVNLAMLSQRLGVDLWSYKTDDGRSIRAALDWLAPYASGEKQWDQQQITDPKMHETARVFRLAANGTGDAKYEAVVRAARGRGGIPESDITDLIYPAATSK